MTKKELSQIYYLKKEIETLETKIKELTFLKSPAFNDSPRSPSPSDPTARQAEQVALLVGLIQGKLCQVRQEAAKIIKYIETVDDSLLRLIIMYRNIDCYTWQEVAEVIGGGNTADGCRMVYNRHFKNRS